MVVFVFILDKSLGLVLEVYVGLYLIGFFVGRRLGVECIFFCCDGVLWERYV